MKILVTGSSGMIGSELVPLLIKSGHIVIGLDRVDPQYTPQEAFVKHDLLYPLPLTQDLEGIDLVIHLAANARVWELVEDPSKSLENMVTVHNAFEFARVNKVPRFIFASSREVYGNGNQMPVPETVGSQRSAESGYGAGKIMGEAYAHAYRKCYGLDVQIVRFSNVYGKYDFSDRFIPKAIKHLSNNDKFEIWGEKKLLDFTYISDAALGIIHLIQNWDKLEHKEWNIAYGKGYTLLSVAQMLTKMMASDSPIEIGESHPGEVFEYEADISRMESLGWSPIVDIEEGLRKSIEYYKANQK